MKKLSFVSVLAIIVAVVALNSCSKVASLLLYDVPLQSGSVTINVPATSDTGATASGSATNSINIDSVIKAYTANALGVSNITSLKLTSINIIVNNPDSTNNLQNFSSLYASFTANTSSTPYVINIPNNPNTYAASLSVPVDSTAELKSYLNGNNFTYSVGGHLRAATTTTLNCTVNFTFDIHVQG